MNQRNPGLLEYAIILVLVALSIIIFLFLANVILGTLGVAAYAAIAAIIVGVPYTIYAAFQGQPWAIWTSVGVSIVCCVLPLLGAAYGYWKITR